MSLIADQLHHRLSSKRKFDDYAGPNDGDYDCDNDDDDDDDDLVLVRMRRDEPDAAESSSFSFPSAAAAVESRVSDAKSTSYRSGSDGVYSGRPPSALQFFIRTISGGKSLVIHADSGDTVRSLHERIAEMTGVPVFEQRLIYEGRQLQWEQSLGECRIENDAGLHLVGRMRSTVSPQAWQVLDDMIFSVCRLCRGESVSALKDIKSYMTEYFSIIPSENGGGENVAVTVNHLQIFLSSSAPAALVMLYASDSPTNKEYGENSVRLFLNLVRNLSGIPYSQCAPVLLEFCKLLRRVGTDDPVYVSCRNALGCLLESNKAPSSSSGGEVLIEVKEVFPFVTELAFSLSRDLILSKDSSLNATGPLPSDVRDFAAFLGPLRDSVSSRGLDCGRVSEHPSARNEVDFLHGIFVELLIKMDDCLRKMEEVLASNVKAEVDIAHIRWSQYLPILKELNSTSKLYAGAEEKLWTLLRSRKASFQTLITKYAKVIEDNLWILSLKEVLNFESRRHLVMLMFPDVKEDYEELHEMLIDRTQLLEESFEYIGNAKQEELHRDLFMEFKNEEATGPGVLREWFVLVCQALFDLQRALFVSCPNDCRRFYPNQASRIEPMHLEYFGFAGRIIALALMHKVQVGVVFDRAFFKQLAGNSLITLEDIRDADPCLYNSCKQILQMDAEFIDSDSLGLTFVREVDELGSIKPVELCPGGKNIIVNSQNREEYVNLLIQHQFVLSISDLVTRFMSGFSDVLAKTEYRAPFFQILELEDLDLMLHGSEIPVSVEDWKAHTEYNGYKETDAQITWFWKIVEEMPAEQRKALLFFWTSIKYLPVEGFQGLQSRLHIYKTPEPVDRLPSSHTCFYRLCFPPYPSKAVLQKRLHVITQEHFGSSFGTW